MLNFKSVFLCLVTAWALTITPCMATGIDGTVLPQDTLVDVDRYLAGLDDAPYHRALKECFQDQQAGGQKYTLPIRVENPELLVLIACSSLMDAGEKQYWYNVLPDMTGEQKERLFNQLSTELRRGVYPALKELGTNGQSLQIKSGN